MNMLGHDHITPQFKGAQSSAALDCFHEKDACAIATEKWESLETRKGQEPNISWYVIPFDLFPVKRRHKKLSHPIDGGCKLFLQFTCSCCFAIGAWHPQ